MYLPDLILEHIFKFLTYRVSILIHHIFTIHFPLLPFVSFLENQIHWLIGPEICKVLRPHSNDFLLCIWTLFKDIPKQLSCGNPEIPFRSLVWTGAKVLFHDLLDLVHGVPPEEHLGAPHHLRGHHVHLAVQLCQHARPGLLCGPNVWNLDPMHRMESWCCFHVQYIPFSHSHYHFDHPAPWAFNSYPPPFAITLIFLPLSMGRAWKRCLLPFLFSFPPTDGLSSSELLLIFFVCVLLLLIIFTSSHDLGHFEFI